MNFGNQIYLYGQQSTKHEWFPWENRPACSPDMNRIKHAWVNLNRIQLPEADNTCNKRFSQVWGWIISSFYLKKKKKKFFTTNNASYKMNPAFLFTTSYICSIFKENKKHVAFCSWVWRMDFLDTRIITFTYKLRLKNIKSQRAEILVYKTFLWCRTPKD